MATARVLRIKSAQNQLIAAAGGLDEVADTFNYGRSTVGRWADVNDPTLMPLAAVIALEAHCGVPLVTKALAEVSGRRLSDPDQGAADSGNVLSRHAEAIVAAGELMSAGALAFADGKVTPAEAVAIDRAAAQLEGGIAALRKALAATRAAGGESGLGVVTGGRA
jgi:hypothetical protein